MANTTYSPIPCLSQGFPSIFPKGRPTRSILYLEAERVAIIIARCTLASLLFGLFCIGPIPSPIVQGTYNEASKPAELNEEEATSRHSHRVSVCCQGLAALFAFFEIFGHQLIRYE